METKHKITPRHEVHGFMVEWFFQGDGGSWNEYNSSYIIPTMEAAKGDLEQCHRFEGWSYDRLRIVPKSGWVEEFPTQDYIEQSWLRGYQGARKGEENPYGEADPDANLNNHLLWEEGAAAFRDGLKLFGG